MTINMPRIAYLAKDKKDFFDRLDKLMDIAARSLKIKRTVITKLLDNGLYPYTKRYLGTFNNHFSTIGLVGMNEAGLNAKWLRKDLTHKETQDFTVEVLNHMRERLSDYQEQYGDPIIWRPPPPSPPLSVSQSTTSSAFRHHHRCQELRRHPLLHQQLPPARGIHRGHFLGSRRSGRAANALHLGYRFPRIPGRKAARLEGGCKSCPQDSRKLQAALLHHVPTYSVCKTHGYLSGEQKKCPICGETTEIYSRITGYYRPVQNWNDGKTRNIRTARFMTSAAPPSPTTALSAERTQRPLRKR